jgi:pyrroloquinoline quinone biosynthesis protein B
MSNQPILLLALSALLLLPACAAVSENPPEGEGRFELVVLGIAQDGGLPHVGCTKECCRVARQTDRVVWPASLGVHDLETGKLVLIEVTPAVEPQLALLHGITGQEGRERRPVDAVLITHAHIGHYSGLVHFGREVASTRKLPLFASERFTDFIQNNGPWSQLVELGQISPRIVEPSRPFAPIEGLEITAISVPHRDEFSDTLAFRIRGSNRTVLFVPDIDAWTDPLLSELLDGVDVAYLDATFYDGRELPGRDLSEIPHPLMTQTMERLADEARASPGRFRFIHLNHTNPALHSAQIQEEILERGFRVARQGERVRF